MAADDKKTFLVDKCSSKKYYLPDFLSRFLISDPKNNILKDI